MISRSLLICFIAFATTLRCSVMQAQTNNTYDSFCRIKSADELIAGMKYLIVCENSAVAMSAANGDTRSYATVSIKGDIIKTETGTDAVHVFTLGGNSTDGFTLQSDQDGKYLSLTKSANNLMSSDKVNGNTERWMFYNGDGRTQICNKAYTRYIRFNSSSLRFACYGSGQQPVQFFRGIAKGDVNNDGIVNESDIISIVEHILNNDNARETPLADVNNDKRLDSLDIIALCELLKR